MSFNPYDYSPLSWGGNITGSMSYGDTMDEMKQYYDKMMAQGQNNLQPYNTAGQNTIPMYQDWMKRMGQNAMNFNPQQSVNDLQKGYTETPYAKYMTSQALNTINNQAAMGGTLGGGQNLRDAGTMANQIASGDFQNYMKNVFNQQNYGLDMNKMYGGAMTNLMGLGQTAANNENTYMANMAKLRGGAEQGEADADANMWQGIGNLGTLMFM